MTFADYSLPDYYDASIELAVGRFILLCGQMDGMTCQYRLNMTNVAHHYFNGLYVSSLDTCFLIH
jgi:hypothetical protein